MDAKKNIRIDKEVLKGKNLKAAMDEVERIRKTEPRGKLLREVANSGNLNLLLHSFSSMKTEIDDDDVTDLIGIMEELQSPDNGGEEVVLFERVMDEMAKAVELRTNTTRSIKEKQDPENMKSFLSNAKRSVESILKTKKDSKSDK